MLSTSKIKVIVGMSGGVDSSVSAYLLQQQGYAVEGLFMKNWEEDDTADYCSASADLADAEQVCKRLDIPLHKVNFSSEYWDEVFEHFLAEYAIGRTPNPDVICNREIKFKAFLEHAQRLGANYIATGHYARRDSESGCQQLLRGCDTSKDQSYFLYALNQHQLSHALFPVGTLDKSTVRMIAEQQGFNVFNKKDSTGICFIGERKFKDFLQDFLPRQPGIIQSVDGRVLGEHSGLMFYTIGQRQGLGIGGMQQSNGNPWYVVEKNISTNTLIVAQGKEHPRLFHSQCSITDLHWIGEKPSEPFSCTAKIRYRQPDQACQLSQLQNDSIRVEFEQVQWAITPGQAVVFYDQAVCLGGATIDQAFNPPH